MLSSGGLDPTAEQFTGSEIAAFLTKPVRRSDLLESILAALRRPAEPGRPVAPAPAPCVAPGRRLRVLLAEDNAVNRKLATHLLEGQGHEVVAAADGKEALAILDERPVDVVLMDVQMPEMDGFEAAARIRERERGTGRHLPIVAMTAYAMKGDREKCLSAGMDGYVAKPIRAEELLRAIAAVAPALEASGAGEGEASPAVVFDSGAQLAPASGDLVNRPALLARVRGHRQFLAELIEEFLRDECPRLTDAIRAAVADGDARRLQQAAHTLKGSLASLCAEQASRAAQRLEAMGRTAQLAGAAAACDALQQEIARLRPDLTGFAQALRAR